MILAANLVLRFVLEICGLVAAGYWGFAALYGWPLRILAGIGLPVVMAAAWGIFRVPNDGGRPVVAVAPQVRLAIEVVFFGLAVGLLAAAGHSRLALAFLVVLLIHYAVGYERTLALLSGRLPPDIRPPFGG